MRTGSREWTGRTRFAVAGALLTLMGCSAAPSPAGPAPASPADPSTPATSSTSSTASSTASATGRADLSDVTLQVPTDLRQSPFDTKRTLSVPRGWTISLWARVDGARLATWTPDRRLLVSRPESGDVVELTPSSSGPPQQRTLVSGLRKPHGLTFVGDTLYVAESNQVNTFRYGSGAVTDRKVIIGGLPDASLSELHGRYAHALKSVVVGRDGSVYVSVGSTGNITPEDRSADPQRASILRWSPDSDKLTVFARGVRNGTGLAFDPDGALWTAVNNRDRLSYPYHRDFDGDGKDDYGKELQSYVNDHPLEPVAKLSAGRDLGWPYCDPDPSTQPGVADSPLSYSRRPFVDDPDTNPDGSKLDCAALAPIEQGLPAHSAPLGMAFTTLPKPFGTGAVIASHGSWNRNPPQASLVSFFPWHNGQLGEATTLASGFQLSDGSRWGRVVGVAPGPDGAIYLTDDQAGAVYRLSHS